MTKPMTHLEAFMSEDGRRGREWREYNHTYRRNDRCLERRLDSSSDWKDVLFQVAAMENSECTWANEPKTLTPQEALRALADGKCVQSSRFIYKLVGKEIHDFNSGRDPAWFPVTYIYRDDSTIVPDPSQPAEPSENPLEHNNYCDKAGTYPRSHPCVRCQSDYLKRKQQESK